MENVAAAVEHDVLDSLCQCALGDGCADLLCGLDIAAANSLGLHKIGNETVQPDNPQTRGKIAKIGYLLQVTEE